jgi:hypothetical protein
VNYAVLSGYKHDINIHIILFKGPFSHRYFSETYHFWCPVMVSKLLLTEHLFESFFGSLDFYIIIHVLNTVIFIIVIQFFVS